MIAILIILLCKINNFSCLLARRKFYFIYFISAPFFSFSFFVSNTKEYLHYETQRIFALLRSFYLTISDIFFSRGRDPQRIFLLSYIFHGACCLNPLRYIVHSRYECRRKEHRNKVKKGESRTDVRKGSEGGI